MRAQMTAMNYKKQKSDAYVALGKATQARDAKYPGGSTGIDQKYAAGWYVDPATPNIVEVDGAPYDCNQNNILPIFGSMCCYSAGAAQAKCCVCKQKVSCSTTGICLGICGGSGTCTNGILKVNRFQAQIDADNADLANMNSNINLLKANYTAIMQPASTTLVDTSCCNSQINSGISATMLSFNPINNTCAMNTVSPSQNIMRNIFSDSTSNQSKFTIKNFLGVFGR
jgi:hypothetical protein